MLSNPATLSFFTGLALTASFAAGEPFAFQGQLGDGGAPADGTFDLQFVLYSDQVGGSPVGSSVTIDDEQVIDGNFLVELDFGDGVFDGGPRWVEIGVREGASTGAFTTLEPRAKVGYTPQASYAGRAGTAAEVDDQFWRTGPGIVVLGEHQGNDQFVFNRDFAVETSDVLVVHSAMTGPGGLTMSAIGGGMPYFGYAVGGISRAKTYYDAVTDAWVVSKGGGDVLEIDGNDDVVITNNLIVGGTITSMDDPGDFEVSYKSFTPDAIFDGFGFERTFNALAGAIVTPGSNLYLRADLDLPHGAQITNIRIEYVDRSSGTDLSVQLWKRDLATIAFTNEVLGVSSGFDSGMVQVMDINPSPAIEIDYTMYTYDLRAFSTAGSWPTAGFLGIRSILVEYTLP